MKYCVLIAAALAVAYAQKQQQQTAPVAILKQINKHNEDGSYSYGYESADGSYKIETKYPNGEVYGKYGYVDDQGQLREVEYGASRRGFEPAGSEINAAPPTLNINTNAVVRPLAPNEEDDGQYREDPSVYYQNEAANQKQAPAPAPAPAYQPRYTQPVQKPFTFQSNTNTYTLPAPTQQTYQPQQSFQPQPQPQPQPQQSYQPQSFQSFQPQILQPAVQQPVYQQPTYQQPTYQQPAYQPQPQPAFRPQTNFQSFQNTPSHYSPAQFNGHPATNIDINSGSYSVQYK